MQSEDLKELNLETQINVSMITNDRSQTDSYIPIEDLSLK